MKNILLVAENKASEELLRELEQFVDRDTVTLRGKISEIRKKTKDKDKYPILKLHNGRMIDDINDIYFYILNNGTSSRRQPQSDYPSENFGDYRNYDSYLENEIGADGDGKPIRSIDLDEEPAVRTNRYNDEDDSEEDTRVDMKDITRRFEEKRGNIRVPKIKNGRPVEYDTEPPRRKKKVKKARKQESSDDDISEDRYPDGGRELDDYLTSQARSRD